MKIFNKFLKRKLIKIPKKYIFGNTFDKTKDYYKTLNISKNSKPIEIKKQYYKLVKKHHPDKGGTEKKIKEINEAYEVLSDQNKKKEYDAERAFGGNFNYNQNQQRNQNYNRNNQNYQRGSQNYNRNNHSDFNQKDFDEIYKQFFKQFKNGNQNSSHSYNNYNRGDNGSNHQGGSRRESYRIFKDQFGNIRYEKMGTGYKKENPFEKRRRDFGGFEEREFYNDSQGEKFKSFFEDFFDQDSERVKYQERESYYEKKRKENEFKKYQENENYNNDFNKHYTEKQQRLNYMLSQKIYLLKDCWNVFKHSSANNGYFKGFIDALKNYLKKNN